MSGPVELRGAARQVRRMARGVMDGRIDQRAYRDFRADLIEELLATGRSPQDPLPRHLAERFRPAEAETSVDAGTAAGAPTEADDPAFARTLPGSLGDASLAPAPAPVSDEGTRVVAPGAAGPGPAREGGPGSAPTARGLRGWLRIALVVGLGLAVAIAALVLPGGWT
jgi:hypothetical protein